MRSSSPKIVVFRDALTSFQDVIEATYGLRAYQTREGIRLPPEPASESLVRSILSSSEIQHPTVHSLVSGTQSRLRKPMTVQTFGWRPDILSILKDGRMHCSVFSPPPSSGGRNNSLLALSLLFLCYLCGNLPEGS